MTHPAVTPHGAKMACGLLPYFCPTLASGPFYWAAQLYSSGGNDTDCVGFFPTDVSHQPGSVQDRVVVSLEPFPGITE